MMTWYIQIQDQQGHVLTLNKTVGNYQKYSKCIDNAANKIVAQFPTAWKWEIRSQCYTHKVLI